MDNEFDRDMRVHVHYNRKISDSNYGSFDFGLSRSFNVADGEDAGELQRQEYAEIRELCKEEYLRWKGAEKEWDDIAAADRYVKVLEERLEQVMQYVRAVNQVIEEKEIEDWISPAHWEWWK